ncbi:ankyrin repeat-containing domain protein, partial [Lactifluus volemus]
MWDAATGGVAFSPGDKHTVSASLDGNARVNFTDQFLINSDGWICGRDGELLMWIPLLQRPFIYRPSTLWVAGEHRTRLELSRFVHGLNWATVYVATPLHLHTEEDQQTRTLLHTDNNTPSFSKSQRESFQVAEIPPDYVTDAHAQDESNKTLLHVASQKGDSRIALLFLDCGADVDARDNDNMTPLHWAVQEGQLNVTQLLLNRLADPNARDSRNWPPLHVALHSGRLAIAKILLD